MSNESLASWTTDTAIILLGTLPLQTLDSSTVLVEQYLSATGGWVPDDAGDPTGPGVPASGETTTQAANTITDEQLERIYNTKITANIDVGFHVVQNLDPGLSDDDVLVLIQETIENFLQSQFVCTSLSLDVLNESTGTTKQGGRTTADERVAAQAAVESGDKLIDPVHVSLKLARDRFDLDDLWNVSYIYNEPSQDIVALVERYTDTTYATLDPLTLTQNVVTIDATTYELASGVTKTRIEE